MQPGKKRRPRNNAIQLLPRPVDVGCSGKHHGKIVALEKSHQMQITSRPGSRIGRTGVEGCILPYHAGAAPINFWGGHMEIFFQSIPLAELLVESDIRHHIGLVPMDGSQPAFRHHALGRKVRHPSEILFPGQATDLLRFFIQIHA